MSTRMELPAHQLAEHHFRAHPVWRFMDPGESLDPDADESHVVAHALGLSKGGHASYLVSAQFRLKNGVSLPGFVQVGLLGQQVECTPSAVFARGKAVDPLGRDSALRLKRILQCTDAQPVG